MLCTDRDYRVLEGISGQLPPLCVDALSYLILSFQAYLSLIELSVHEKWKASTAFA